MNMNDLIHDWAHGRRAVIASSAGNIEAINYIRGPARSVAFLAAACVIALFTGDVKAQSSAPLLREADLDYHGAFRLPGGTSDPDTFSYAGEGIAYNPANNSLFVTGHKNYQRTTEISIPAIINGSSLSDLRTGSFLQPFHDALDGRRNSINPSDSNGQRIGGYLVYDNRLIVSVFSYYDANGTQQYSHFERSLSLSQAGTVQGPIAVGSDVHYTSGYMAHIPPEWQSAFGGPLLTGNCCRSIISNQSHGPSVSVFDSETFGSSGSVAATRLVGYPSSNPLGPGETTQNPYFNLTTRVTGVVFPNGTRSVLFFGRHGTGPYCYGDGDECGDPADSSKGTHAYPYAYQVWAYDANDLLRVKNGEVAAYEIQPYDVWTLELPFSSSNDTYDSGGAAYDAENDRIFFIQSNRGGDAKPLIAVLGFNRGPRPMAPDNFSTN